VSALPCPTEHAEQVALFQIASIKAKTDDRWLLLYAVPNGGKRSIGVAVKLKAEGAKAGVPDMFLPVAIGGNHGLYVELKRVRGGALSPEQRAWIALLRGQGYCVAVCRGCTKAADAIRHYLAGLPVTDAQP